MNRIRILPAAAVVCLGLASCDSPAAPGSFEAEPAPPAHLSIEPASTILSGETRAMIFESETFVRESGQPSVAHREFSTAGFDPPYQLHLTNGTESGEDRVSSARVSIDGVEVLGPSNFNENVTGYLFDVTLGDVVTLDVELEGAPGDQFTIHIDGELKRAAGLGSGGGTAVLEGGEIVLEVPPGAVDDETTFTAEPVDDTTDPPPEGTEPLPGTRIELGPDGAQFSEPVEVTVRVDLSVVPTHVPVENLRLFVLEDRVWVPLPGGVDPVTGEVTGATLHFSEFAVLSVAEFCPGRGGGAFESLREALDATIDGGAVVICDGTHAVEGVVVDRPVTILAEAGASPVLQTSTATSALLIDGISAGTVVINRLSFDFDTPTPDANGVTTYAIRAENEYERVEIRNSSFDVDEAARGAIALTGSAVPTATALVDSVTITGGQFGIAIQDVGVQVTRLGLSGTSILGVSIADAAGSGANVRIENGSFADCGTRCIRPVAGSHVEVVGNTFGQCGSQRCVSVGSGADVVVSGNTFAAPVLIGDSGPDPEEIILFAQGSSGVIHDNSFGGCGWVECVDARGTSVVAVTANEFTYVPGLAQEEFAAVLSTHLGATTTIANNVLNGCARICYKVIDGSTTTISNDTISTTAEHGTEWILDAANPGDPGLPANSILFENNVVTGSGTELGMILFEGNATVTGNLFQDIGDGASVQGGSSLTGRDNVFGLSGTALSILDGTADFRFNDFTGQSTDIGSAGDGTSILTCNWWGTTAGPVNVDPNVPSEVYTPWALAPVAGTGAVGCSGGS